jgi:hypothetical protein
MVTYTCNLCNKNFSKKSNYEYHKNRKRVCNDQNKLKTVKKTENAVKKTENAVKKTVIIKLFHCNGCNKNFTRKDSLNVHEKTRCKLKLLSDKINNEKEEIYQNLIKRLESQNQKIEELEKKLSEKSVINNIQNNTQINGGIKLLAHGTEDLTFLTDKIVKKLLSCGYQSVPKIIEEVHFNEKKPENANIYISNIKDPYVMIYNGTKWDLKYKDAALDDLFENNTDYLEDRFEELLITLDERTKNRFLRFLNKRDKDDTKNTVKQHIKLLLYNKKGVSLKMIKNKPMGYILN